MNEKTLALIESISQEIVETEQDILTYEYEAEKAKMKVKELRDQLAKTITDNFPDEVKTANKIIHLY